jgi:hypothetical protein
VREGDQRACSARSRRTVHHLNASTAQVVSDRRDVIDPQSDVMQPRSATFKKLGDYTWSCRRQELESTVTHRHHLLVEAIGLFHMCALQSEQVRQCVARSPVAVGKRHVVDSEDLPRSLARNGVTN